MMNEINFAIAKSTDGPINRRLRKNTELFYSNTTKTQLSNTIEKIPDGQKPHKINI